MFSRHSASPSVPSTAAEASNGTPLYEVYCDAGHGYGKFICDNRRAVFPTLIASVQPDTANFASLKSSHRPFVIDVAGQSYAIGDDALEARRNLRRRLDLAGLGGELHKVIILAGLTQVAPQGGKIRLVTQMPIAWYGHRDKLFNLAGTYEVGYGGRQLHYVLEREAKRMVIYPESFGALACYCFDASGVQVNDFQGSRVAVIDAGTETTNVGVYEGLRFVPQQSFTVSAGMSDIWEHVAGAINRDYGRKPALDDIDRALRDQQGLFRLGAKQIDLNEERYLPFAALGVAETVIAEIHNKLAGGTLVHSFLGAGGCWPRIQASFEQAFDEQLLSPADFPTVDKLDPWLLNITGLRRFEAFRHQ